jgi:hypothetical protein
LVDFSVQRIFGDLEAHGLSFVGFALSFACHFSRREAIETDHEGLKPDSLERVLVEQQASKRPPKVGSFPSRLIVIFLGSVYRSNGKQSHWCDDFTRT